MKKQLLRTALPGKRLCIATAFLGSGLLLALPATARAQNSPEADFPTIAVRCPPLPASMDFCQEPVPLDYFLARERLERELMVNTHLHGGTMLLLKRAQRYFPVIEPILAEEGIPDDFKYLCAIESHLENVVSPAKAAGFWQFLEGTAREYGLEVNSYVDERYNLEKATRAACRFLLYLKDRTGSWTLAAAAYNTGLSNMLYHIRHQGTHSYYHLHVAEETSRYLYRILAVKLIMENPRQYGFLFHPEEGYPPLPTKEITVRNRIDNLFAFAREQGVSYQLLKFCNPWLRKNHLPNKSHKAYTLRLPENLPGNPPEEIRPMPSFVPSISPGCGLRNKRSR